MLVGLTMLRSNHVRDNTVNTFVIHECDFLRGMNTLAERLLAARNEAGLTQTALAQKARVSQGTIGNIESGVRQQPRELLKIASALDVRPEWLLDGKMPKRSNVAPGPELHGRVPLISWVAAGTWSEAADPYSVGDAEDWLACPRSHGPRTFALRVRGLSMYNPGGRWSYQEGEIIFVDPDRRPAHGDRVVVRLEDKGETTFKQYIEEGPDRFLKALNPSWPDPIIRVGSDATMCGVVIGKWSE